ncbi:MAG: hypothetical protein JST75_15850 [Bacteroidetes bacterium]|nr:hypothetical protein [Bacteroidota bacterium]
MEDIEMKNMWKVYDQMIEQSKVLNLQSWALNLSCFETLQTQKAKSKLRALILPKMVVILLGIGWALFVGFIFYYTLSQTIIAISLAAILILTVIGIITYIHDITIITQINYSESIITTQKKIATLQSSIINSIRISWLQLPFYTLCFIPNKLALSGGFKFWIIQTIVTAVSIWLAVVLFKNISLKNINKKWVKGFMRGYGLNRVSKAMEFINEIEEFKKDNV